VNVYFSCFSEVRLFCKLTHFCPCSWFSDTVIGEELPLKAFVNTFYLLFQRRIKDLVLGQVPVLGRRLEKMRRYQCARGFPAVAHVTVWSVRSQQHTCFLFPSHCSKSWIPVSEAVISSPVTRCKCTAGRRYLQKKHP